MDYSLYLTWTYMTCLIHILSSSVYLLKLFINTNNNQITIENINFIQDLSLILATISSSIVLCIYLKLSNKLHMNVIVIVSLLLISILSLIFFSFDVLIILNLFFSLPSITLWILYNYHITLFKNKQFKFVFKPKTNFSSKFQNGKQNQKLCYLYFICCIMISCTVFALHYYFNISNTDIWTIRIAKASSLSSQICFVASIPPMTTNLVQIITCNLLESKPISRNKDLDETTTNVQPVFDASYYA